MDESIVNPEAIDELKEIFKNHILPYNRLMDICSIPTDIMYSPNTKMEFLGKMVEGDEKFEIIQKHNYNPYLCWNDSSFAGLLLTTKGVMNINMHGFNVVPLSVAIKLLSH